MKIRIFLRQQLALCEVEDASFRDVLNYVVMPIRILDSRIALDKPIKNNIHSLLHKGQMFRPETTTGFCSAVFKFGKGILQFFALVSNVKEEGERLSLSNSDGCHSYADNNNTYIFYL